jgi:hypothetical protein
MVGTENCFSLDRRLPFMVRLLVRVLLVVPLLGVVGAGCTGETPKDTGKTIPQLKPVQPGGPGGGAKPNPT